LATFDTGTAKYVGEKQTPCPALTGSHRLQPEPRPKSDDKTANSSKTDPNCRISTPKTKEKIHSIGFRLKTYDSKT